MIKKSTLLHMEFWSKLSEEHPNLAQLRDIGQKTNSSAGDVEQLWLKSCHTGANLEAMALYGKFLIEIRNDKEAGERLLEKAKQDNQIVQNNEAYDPLFRESLQAKTKEAIDFIVRNKEMPTAIKKLKHMAHSLVLVLFLVVLLSYWYTWASLTGTNNINKKIDLLDTANLLRAELMQGLSGVQNLYLINNGVLNDLTDQGRFQYDPRVIRKELKASLESATTLKEQLKQQASSASPGARSLLNIPNIPLYKQNSAAPVYSGVIQAIEDVISSTFRLLDQADSDINSSNPDYYYVTYNLLNQFYQGLTDFSNDCAELLYSATGAQSNNTSKLLFLSIAVIYIGALLLAFMNLPSAVQRVNKAREEVLCLLLNIPENVTKNLYRKCERFSSSLRYEEQESMGSRIESQELLAYESNAQGSIPAMRRNRKFKDLGMSYETLRIIFLGVALVLAAYFIFVPRATTSDTVSEDVRNRLPELNATSAAEPFFSFMINAERQLLMNSTFPILNTSAEMGVINNVMGMYNLTSLILEEHYRNSKIHTKKYEDLFIQLMMSNPCDYMLSSVTNEACVTFADQTVFQGMRVALSRHFENLGILFSCFMDVKNGGSCAAAPITPKNLNFFGDEAFLNQTNNLLRTTQALQIDLMQHVYIKNTFRILMVGFKSSIPSNIQNHDVDVLAIFITLLVVVYIFFWHTFTKNMQKEADILAVALCIMKARA